MHSRPERSPLTFEDAMSLHLYRALLFTRMDMIRRFGNYPKLFTEILTGRLYAESWATAVEKFTRGDYWHPEVAGMIADKGYMRILSALTAAAPSPPRCHVRRFYISKFNEAAGLR